MKYADYVYVFGTTASFEAEDVEDPISKCERLGIGILSVNFNENAGVVNELLEARRNNVDKKLHRGLPLWLPHPFGVILLRNTPGVTLAW